MEQVYKIDSKGKVVLGAGFPAFIHNGDYYVVHIKVYEDGMVDCWGQCSFEEFEQKVKSGWIVTRLPKEGRVDMFELFQANARHLDTYIEEEEFIKELKDALLELQDKATSQEICLQEFANYLHNPNESNRKRLEKSYEAVPKHLRLAILGEMEMGDGPIKYIIAGNAYDEQTIESLKSHFIM